MNKILLFLMFLILLTTSQHAQQNDNLLLLKEHKYVEFLQQSKPMVESIVKDPSVKFDELTAIAVALEKSKSWDEQAGNDITKWLKPSFDAERYMAAIKQLVKNDSKNIAMLYIGKSPESMSMSKASKILSDHEFKLASDVIGVFVPIDPRSRFIKLLNIPKDKRVPVETVLLNNVIDAATRNWLGEAALDLYLNPPKDTNIETKECFNYALLFNGKAKVITLETARILYENGRKDDAIQLTIQVTKENPNDATIQKEAINLLTGMGQTNAANMVYQQAMTNVSEHKRRTMRMENLESLQRNKQVDEINQFQANEDALIAGDAFLVLKKYSEASQKYLTILNNKNMPLERRITAWIGLFEANPEQAMKIHKELFSEMENIDKKSTSIFVIVNELKNCA